MLKYVPPHTHKKRHRSCTYFVANQPAHEIKAPPRLSLLVGRELFCWGDRRLSRGKRWTARPEPAQNTNILLQHRTEGHGSLMKAIISLEFFKQNFMTSGAPPVCRCFMGVSMQGKRGCQGETIRLHKCLHTYSHFYDLCPQVNTCWMEGDKWPRKSGKREEQRGEFCNISGHQLSVSHSKTALNGP